MKIEGLTNVNVELSARLGYTKMPIKDVLALGEGSVIELDTLAGTPVDVLCNNQKIGEGEVVVSDEKFGIRIVSLLGEDK